MRIGIPKENLLDEKRIALSPAGVDSLVRAGHTVYYETNAGSGSHFKDEDYVKTGATLVYSAEEVYKRSELIVKVTSAGDNELEFIQDNQIIFSFLHLAVGKKQNVEKLLKKKVTAIGYELIESEGRLPVLHSMSEIAGQIAIQVSERYLEVSNKGGRGILLGGYCQN